MDLYERQQFDFFLKAAVERFVERLEQRAQGPDRALERLREAPESDGVWLGGFVDALFSDFLLDNPDGACFVLRSLAKRPAAAPTGRSVEEMVGSLARNAFAELLKQKTEEALEQRIGYQPVRTGE